MTDIELTDPPATAGVAEGRNVAGAGQAAIRHVYVHIPFCARICPYCAFYKDKLDRSQTSRFCQAIVNEIKALAAHSTIIPTTIFFGGGTPSALSTDQLEFLLNGFNDALDLSNLKEFTVEANPGSVSARKAALLRKLGVSRISLGVQSWDDDLLQLLGREHSASQAEESFHLLRDTGFENINIDLMFGLPGQTDQQWQSTLDKTISLRPNHVSAYCLTYEEDTDFFLRHSRGELRSDADLESDFFGMAMDGLETAGYQQYEISNYALPGFESVHNRAYWSGENYLGIGPSAFSTVDFVRWQNVADYRTYADRVLAGNSAIGSTEDLTSEMKQMERLALGLRTRDGVSAEHLADWLKETREFVELGLLAHSGDNLVLTRSGKCVADSVAAAFV
ncbi:MAG: radical SAM family heme chaperone HemW [Chthoniobacterales bacterium]